MEQIKKLRRRARMKQAELAAGLGVTQSTVSMWENRHNAPRTDKLPEIADILGCEIGDLFTGDEKNAENENG